MNFDEAERKLAELKNQRDSGQLSPAEFTSRVHEIRLQDIGDVWWQISEQDGKWLRWNGSAWVPGEPVRIVASSAAATKSAAAGSEQKRKYVIIGLLGIVVIAYIASTIGGIGG